MDLPQPPQPTRPTFEHHPTGLGVGQPEPRISWKFQSSGKTIPGWKQSAYEIKIWADDDEPNQHDIFKVNSADSVCVPWPTQALRSRQRLNIQVRCFGHDGHAKQCEPTEWSPTATVEAGLFARDDWTSSFIGSTSQQDEDGSVHPIQFWKEFTLPVSTQPNSRARLYITSLGVFEVFINGQLASDECLAPGWTSYKNRLTYRTLDVGSLLKSDTSNTICIHVGEGWYAGRLGFGGGSRFHYGSRLGALAQLDVFGSDGNPWTVGTDQTWSSSLSAVQSSSIYDGEFYDDRAAVDISSGPPEKTDSVVKLPWPEARIVATDSPPVTVNETKAPQQIWRSPGGKVLVDFGQNLVGKLRIRSVRLASGARLVLKFAEVLENGELGTRPLRLAKCTDTIIGAGRDLVDWTPTFTFHGFRFVEIQGWPDGLPEADDLSALVMYSAMRRQGHFHCSNNDVNQLHENVIWSMKGNFLSIPTDCPQRDERMGWTGDIQAFTSTAAFLFDTGGFLSSWLEDVADETLEADHFGVPPLVVPNVLPAKPFRIPQAIWGDVTISTPFDVYRATGDVRVLAQQFDSMVAWLDHGVDRGPDGLWSFDRWQLADWLDPAAPPENPGDSRTDNVLVADAFLVWMTGVMHNICRILDRPDMESKYRTEHGKLRLRFQQKYVTRTGNLMSNTQTAIALAAQFGLYENAEQFQTAASAIQKLVRTAKFTIATGFAGTPVITHALTRLGLPQLAYRMLLEKACPSWMYPITMGATTIWERWNSMLPDGSINPGEMTSFNHYALGAVANWLHSTVGGISPLEPGWKKFVVRPVPGGDLTSAEVALDGPYGQIKCAWQWAPDQGGHFRLELTVPANSSAVVVLPSINTAGAYEVPHDNAPTVLAGYHVFEHTFKAAEWPPQPLKAWDEAD